MRLTRRSVLRTGALAALSPWSGAVLWSATPARAQGSGVQWGHCLPLSGESKYAAGFRHFDYVNPQAPKGGTLRLAALGTFDNFNQVVAGLKGLFAAAAGTICDTLMVSSLDEPMANYGLIAEEVGHSPNFTTISFRLRAAARHHDGTPITVEDVIFSFEAFKKTNPFIGAFYRDVEKVEKSGEREVTFRVGSPGNHEMPIVLGQLRVLPRHWWEGTDAAGKKRDIGATILEPPLGNAAYRIKEFAAGRRVVYERVKDYWAKDLNVNVGRDNFDEVRYEYFRDPTIALEAFKADHVDWRIENSAKNWAMAYDFSAVKDKRVVLEGCSPARPRDDAGLCLQLAARQVPGSQGAPGVQFCVRFRGDEQAVLLRPIPADQQLLRGHRARLLRPAAGGGVQDTGAAARQGPARGVHHPVCKSGVRYRREGAGELTGGHAAHGGGRLRGARPQAGQRQDRRGADTPRF